MDLPEPAFARQRSAEHLIATNAHYPSVALCDPRFPKWYNEAKVGFKVHWGPYAVPSYGDKPATVVRNP